MYIDDFERAQTVLIYVLLWHGDLSDNPSKVTGSQAQGLGAATLNRLAWYTIDPIFCDWSGELDNNSISHKHHSTIFIRYSQSKIWFRELRPFKIPWTWLIIRTKKAPITMPCLNSSMHRQAIIGEPLCVLLVPQILSNLM